MIEISSRDPMVPRNNDLSRSNYFAFFVLAVLGGIPSLCVWMREPFIITKHEFDFSLGLLARDGGLTPISWVVAGYLVHYLLILGLGLYFCRILVIEAGKKDSFTWRDVLFWGLIICPFAWYLPWLSPDVFCYLGVGWIQSAHDMSPYVYTIAQSPDFPSHAIYTNIYPPWNHVITPYGPLFLHFMSWVAALGQGDEKSCLIILKVIYLAVHFGNAWLAQRIGKALRMPQRAVFLFFLLNPALLLCYVGRLHNDVLMLGGLLAGILFLIEGRPWWAMFFFAASSGFKYVPILMLPCFLAYAMKGDWSWRSLARITGLAFFFLILCFSNHLFIEKGPASFWQMLRGDERLIVSKIHECVAHYVSDMGLSSVQHFYDFTGAVFYLIYGLMGLKLLRLGKAICFQDVSSTLTLMFFWYFVLTGSFHEWYAGWFLVCMFAVNRLDYFQVGLVFSIGFQSLSILTGLRFTPAYLVGWSLIFGLLCACLCYLYRPGWRRDDRKSPLFFTKFER